MSKRCQCVGKKMALLVLRSVGFCVGQNQMCHFVRLAFRVFFLSVCCCTVGRHRVATNVSPPPQRGSPSKNPFHLFKRTKFELKLVVFRLLWSNVEKFLGAGEE